MKTLPVVISVAALAFSAGAPAQMSPSTPDPAGTMPEQPAPVEPVDIFADMSQVEEGMIDTDGLLYADVYGDGQAYIGEVGSVVLTADGAIDALVVDIGGFLGIGVKHVAIGFDAVELYQDESGYLYISTPFTEVEFEEAPAYDVQTYPQDRETIRLSASE